MSPKSALTEAERSRRMAALRAATAVVTERRVASQSVRAAGATQQTSSTNPYREQRARLFSALTPILKELPANSKLRGFSLLFWFYCYQLFTGERVGTEPGLKGKLAGVVPHSINYS